jgi:secondary thiamine-phosphate synthase enzyme
MDILKIRSNQREEMIDITADVERLLDKAGAKGGIVVAFSQHTTCGLTVNENADPDVQTDMLHCLRTLAPQHGMGFRHGEENSDAHIKTTLVGTSATIPFEDGKLMLGRWQGIYLCEFDGARERKVVVKIIPA